jgi:hypothetical protein
MNFLVIYFCLEQNFDVPGVYRRCIDLCKVVSIVIPYIKGAGCLVLTCVEILIQDDPSFRAADRDFQELTKRSQ